MKQWGILMVGIALTAAACSSSPDGTNGDLSGNPTGPSQSTSTPQGNVNVTRVRAFIKDARLQAYVQGELGDGCTSLQGIRQQRAQNTVALTVTSVRQGEVCTMIMQMLNEWVPLEGAFEPGNYTVRANGANVEFALVRDAGGERRIEPDPGPVPQLDDAQIPGFTPPDRGRPEPGDPGQVPPGPPGQTPPSPPRPGGR